MATNRRNTLILDGTSVEWYAADTAITPVTATYGSGGLIITGPASTSIRMYAPNGVIIGAVGSAAILFFEKSATISGQGTNTISLGQSGDTINLNVAGVTYNIGTTLAGNPTFSGNVTITGTLTVNGTTSTINSTTMTVDDPIITLGGDTAPVADDNKDRGVEFRWHNGSAAKVGFFGYDDSTGYFTFIPDATNTSEVFSGSVGSISVNSVFAANRITVDYSATSGDGTWDKSGILIKNNNATASEAALAFQNASTSTNYWILGLNQGADLAFAYGTSFTDAFTRFRISDTAVTVGQTAGTGLYPIYFLGLYSGTTQVMDSSRNMVNIGTINSQTISAAANFTGTLTMAGDLAVNGGDITSTSATFNFLAATVTTLNISSQSVASATTIGSSNPTGLYLYRATNSVGATPSGLSFDGQDSGSARQSYIFLGGYIQDNTAGSEDGSFFIETVRAGALTKALWVNNDGTVRLATTYNGYGTGNLHAGTVYAQSVIITNSSGVAKYQITYNSTNDSLDTIKL